jgi:hypothetical protein
MIILNQDKTVAVNTDTMSKIEAKRGVINFYTLTNEKIKLGSKYGCRANEILVDILDKINNSWRIFEMPIE